MRDLCFNPSLPQGSRDGQVTQSFVSSGLVTSDPQPAPEGDTPGTAQALPHKVLHFCAFGVGFYSYFWDLLPPSELSALCLDILSPCGMPGRDYRFPCHAAVSPFLAPRLEGGTLKCLNILTNEDDVAQ